MGGWEVLEAIGDARGAEHFSMLIGQETRCMEVRSGAAGSGETEKGRCAELIVWRVNAYLPPKNLLGS